MLTEIRVKTAPKLYRRKKEGQQYWCKIGTRINWNGLSDCLYLQPRVDGRSHYKTLKAFLEQYENLDGSAIQP